MNYLVCYDIHSPKRLKKTAKVLEDYGIRVQLSFFQCQINEEKMEELKKRLLDEIDMKEDYLFFYPICENCLQKPIIEGSGQILIQQTFEII